jgi:hypothetical protein
MARRTREIWRNLIGQYERSDKSREQFAAEHGIPVATLKNWIYRIKGEKTDKATAILPVSVISSVSPTARRREDEGGTVEVMLVRFAGGTASELIAEVVTRLRRC